MDAKELRKLRSKVTRLFRENEEGTIIDFLVNGEQKGCYVIPQNHFVSIDMKSPTDWLNQNICFEVDLRQMKTKEKLNVELRVRK
jgi:hypothetical protein